MITGAYARLGLVKSAVRRALVVLCAVALVTVSVVHSVEHFVGTANSVAIQTVVDASGDASDSSKKAPIAVEHCHACTMIALAALAPSVLPIAITTELPVRRSVGLRPHSRIADTPPPKLSI